MTIHQQLRDWFSGLWSDFWRVPLRLVWPVALVVGCVLLEAFWRIGGVLNSTWHAAYHLWFPVRILAMLALLWFVRQKLR